MDDDDGLMAELRAVISLYDAVPTDVVLAAQSAIAYRRLDAELAALSDHASAEPRMAGLRAVHIPTLLIFETDGFTVELELLDEGGSRRLGGQLIPPQSGRVVVHHGGGTLEVVADEVGQFVAEGISPGPLSLQCTVGTRTIATDWFLV
jgi:hypothetical protein